MAVIDKCQAPLAALMLLAVSCSRADLFAITGSSGSAGGQAGSTPGCSSGSLKPGNTTQTLQVGAVSRSFILHVPATYDGSNAVPLVVDFHGLGSSAMNELQTSPYPVVTDPEGVVMAFPDGLKGPLGAAWDLGPCCVADVDDLGFTRALVTQVQNVACIDSHRVYAVGTLTGGGMVYDLACQAADIFAGVAPAAFDLLRENVDGCVPSRPINEITFRGTADPRVPYAGGASNLVPGMPITFLGALATFQRWAVIDGCVGPASPEDQSGCSSYSGCAGGVEVTLCTKQGGRDDPGDASIAWPELRRHAL